MNFNLVVLSIPVFFILIGIEVAVERYQNLSLYRWNDAFTNISCGIAQQVSGIFFRIFTIGFYEMIYAYLRIYTIPENWITFIVLFFLYDMLYYWAHRWSHTVNLFWTGHVVHHQSEDFNFSVALRQSSLQILFTFFVFLPLALIGFSTKQMIIVAGINLLYQFWIHTELIGKMGFLELFMNTPSHHRVHHGKNPEYIDKNYAGVFIIWDRMFGTFEPEKAPVVYGVTQSFKSWNPLWANVENLEKISSQWKVTPGFFNKLKVLFLKPGWRPQEQGGYYPVPEVEKEKYHKFEMPVHHPVLKYVFFQYAILLLGTTIFLFAHEGISIGWKGCFAILIGWGITNAGGLFEGKKIFFILEFLRPFLSILITGVFFYLTKPDFLTVPAIILASGYILLSLWSASRIRHFGTL
ncbi:MAG: sterol desaturase family protein [Bacteroidia bacterium]|nr:sterol desaturase family protein [Bacteroidia bacterium]